MGLALFYHHASGAVYNFFSTIRPNRFSFGEKEVLYFLLKISLADPVCYLRETNFFDGEKIEADYNPCDTMVVYASVSPCSI
jgi:hypothetical protein